MHRMQWKVAALVLLLGGGEATWGQSGAARPSSGTVRSPAALADFIDREIDEVLADAGTDGNNGPGTYRPIPAYLGAQHAPLIVPDPAGGIANFDPAGAQADFDDRATLLDEAERGFLEQYQATAAHAHRTSYQQAMRLMRSSQARRAFDLAQETRVVRDAYGGSKFGEACLLARRLVEAGVPFVEVTLRGWDDHSNAARDVRRRCAYMDPAMTALIGDLRARGLWDSTLLIWMGEFGRSPGRASNHFARAWTTVLAGAGLRTGQVIGSTDAQGATVSDHPISVADFMATICRALGIDYTKRYDTNGGRPVRIVDQGANPIAALLP